MTNLTDETHALTLESWEPSAYDHPLYPVQNLPFCIFSTTQDARPRGGVVIGDKVMDLSSIDLPEAPQLAGCKGPTLNAYLALPQNERRAIRRALSRYLTDKTNAAMAKHLVDQSACTFHLPVQIGDFSDFFAGINHAINAGRMFRPDNPLLPNYKHVPIAYNGRTSSIRSSGHTVLRPSGQTLAHGETVPKFGPTQRLDFELELAIWVGGGNKLGSPIPIADADGHAAAFGLLNDWSARDFQAWESQPLGPFLGKSFMTSVSPFLVTAEALAPFRVPQTPRPAGDPAPLPHLWNESDQGRALDIHMEAWLSTETMRKAGAPPLQMAEASSRDLYWTVGQLIAHHTSNGCNLRPGDLLGTGTISSPTAKGHGSMLELTQAGRTPLTLANGETRSFLHDGDEVTLRAWCERPGFARIGLGEVRGIVTAPR